MIPHFKKGDFGKLIFAVHDQISTQRAIAEVLGALDDKIVANERVVTASEALMISQAASATGSAAVADVAQQSKVTLNPKEFDASVAHFSLPSFDGGKTPELEAAESIKSNKTLLTRPCVLMSKLNPRIPRGWDVATLPEQMAVASTEFVALVPLELSSSVLWAALSEPSVSVGLASQVAGTSGSHHRVKPGDLLNVQIKDPRTLGQEIQRAIADLGSMCHLRRVESRRLAAARDELLPLLMSGRIRVRDAEKVVEEVG